LKIIDYISGNKDDNFFRVIAEYKISEPKNNFLMRAGCLIVLREIKRKHENKFSSPSFKAKKLFYKKIRSLKDKREMVIIPAGNFIFGTDSGRKDESPRKLQFVDDFYIDKYEVSNRDYLKYIRQTGKKGPLSWKKEYPHEKAGYPVLVTYYEAKAYAKWAGKRLPTEKQWEKAAKGPCSVEIKKTNIYPWGNRYIPDYANSLELWKDADAVKIVRLKYKILKKGLIPVKSFKKGTSCYGVYNMSGNAAEWTSDWYSPYKGNYQKNSNYGTQYKVIRGGAWFDKKERLRVTARGRGGIPNLYSDNIAGFRCVREPHDADIRSFVRQP